MSSRVDSSPWRLEWSDALSVGIPEIDVEHQRFIGLVNELNEAIIGRLDLAVIKNRMQSILEDAAAHFAHEEELFREWGYPEASEHAMKHAQITLALHGIMTRFERGGMEYEWIEAGLKVKEALIEHLLAEDMKYRDYAQRTGLGRVNPA
ncbi:MAG: hemerythrin family protein [Nitrosomonadales bacterium]|nr:hemerythrin family protein [Nitrosomonadales bacterium]